MGIILGVDNLIEMFEEKYYRNLNGGILEKFGIIFTRDVKIYLYPFQPDKNSELLNSTIFLFTLELKIYMTTYTLIKELKI